MIKKCSLLLALCLLLSAVSLSFSSCGLWGAPKIEEIYDRVVELVEKSYELNAIFYGEGLPYYDRNLPIYADLYKDYTTDSYTRAYNIVSRNAKYPSVEAIKLAAEQVYSLELLEKTVYPAAFVGIVIGNNGKGSYVSGARYIESENQLYISVESQEESRPVPLVYDYATMKIVRPSNSKKVLISVDAWEEPTPDRRFSARLSLVLQDGKWMLDKLTV